MQQNRRSTAVAALIMIGCSSLHTTATTGAAMYMAYICILRNASTPPSATPVTLGGLEGR